MPQVPKRAGRVVRDPNFRDQVVGREVREGELEVSAERVGDWSGGETIVPSPKKAAQIQGALKNALKSQLEAESASLGNIDEVAIHGKTGISWRPGEEQTLGGGQR